MSAGKGKKEDNPFLNSVLDKLSKPYKVQAPVILSAADTSVDQMFAIANRMESNWGIEGYDAPKKYADPQKQMKDREYLLQKKGLKDKNHVTKRGNYLDDLKKVTDGVPASNKYDVVIKWKDPKEKLSKPLSAPPKRQTFIDEIFKEQKVRSIPGAGKYNLEKPLKEQLAEIEEQKKKKLNYPDRPNFLCEYEYLAGTNPGPGNYNGRLIQDKIKINNTKPKEMIQKHKEQDKKRGKSAFPDCGSYKPQPCDYLSFGKMLQLKQEKAEEKGGKKNFWGLDARFKDPKSSKSKLNVPVPGPGQYPLIATWLGKEEGMKKDKKGKNWMESITKGTQKSIYY